jgi:hypothetical protein
MRMLRSITSQMPSYIRAEPNMVTSRWIQGMISPPAVTNIPRPVNRLCTSSTSTARQLLCPRQLCLKDHHSLKKVVEVAGIAKAEVAQLSKRNTGRPRS